MRDVVTTSAVFFSYALLAVFAQNAVFTRALGVSRLVQLVGDDRTSSWLFGMQLCITQVLVTPFAWYAGSRIAPLANRVQLRPLVYIASIAVVCLLEHAVLWLAKGLPHRSALLRIVPLAGLNSCVLGTVLVERTQSFTLEQSIGFGLGSGGFVSGLLQGFFSDGGVEHEGDAAGVVVHAAAVMAQTVGYHKPGHAEHHVVAHNLVENLLGQPD